MGFFDVFGDPATDPSTNPQVRQQQQNTADAVAEGEKAADSGDHPGN